MDDSLKEKIIGLEKRLFQADVRTSATELNKMLDDDFMEFGSVGGIYSKEQIINSLEAEPEVEIMVKEFDLRQLSSDVVLIAYRALIRYKGIGREKCSLRSSIWKLTDDNWRLIFHQGTPTRNI